MRVIYWIVVAVWFACLVATIVLASIPKTRFKLAYMLCVTAINLLAMLINLIDLLIRYL